MGINLDRLLNRAEVMVNYCSAKTPADMNPGLVLGAILGQMALDGREKLTLLADPAFSPLGAWLEQLIAESSGKNGRGIIFVDGEPERAPQDYFHDRLFVYLRTTGDLDSKVADLINCGHPAITIDIKDVYDLGTEFYRWEVATTVACAILGVNAFDQPDVQLSKDITKRKIAQYIQSKKLEEDRPAWLNDDALVFSPMELSASSLREVLLYFVSAAHPYDFLGINAYLPRNPHMEDVLQQLRSKLGKISSCATTLGFGPRFLHSTGQLHKGGENTGVFIQITVDPALDMEIPEQGMTFGTLERAQALGDYESLVERGRRIIRIHFSSPFHLEELVKAI